MTLLLALYREQEGLTTITTLLTHYVYSHLLLTMLVTLVDASLTMLMALQSVSMMTAMTTHKLRLSHRPSTKLLHFTTSLGHAYNHATLVNIYGATTLYIVTSWNMASSVAHP